MKWIEIDFSKYSSIKIGPKRRVKVIEKKEEFEGEFLIGGANNLLISPNTKKSFAILGKNFDYIIKEGSFLRVGAATKGSKLFNFCKKNNLGGLEFIGKIPGTIGGMVKMNAGIKEYEIANRVVKVIGSFGVKTKDEIGFSYRKSRIDGAIFEVVLKVDGKFNSSLAKKIEKMKENQPKFPSVGSCFKNPKGAFAGKILEELGFRGKRIGEVGFSREHANFLVNYGKGNFFDAITLIQEAKKRAKEIGIVLEEEVKIIF